MSTLSEREAVLRRALLAAAEQIEPGADGLERIRSRMRRPRPHTIAWLEAAATDWYFRLPDRLQAACQQAACALRQVWDRFGPSSEPGQKSRPLNWLRPVAAMMVAIFVIAAGAYVALDNPESIFPAGSHSRQSPGGSGPAGGHSGHSAGNSLSGTGTPGPSAGSSNGSASPTACPTPVPTGTFHPAPTPTPSTSVSATPSATPSVSPSATPTPTGSSTPDPSASSTPPGGESTSAPAAAQPTSNSGVRSGPNAAAGGAAAKPKSAGMTSAGTRPCTNTSATTKRHSSSAKANPDAITLAKLTAG